MKKKKNSVEELVTYIQEHCLWQFHSRSWDRLENIEGVLSQTAKLMQGEAPSRETEAEKCWYADARVLAAEFKAAFPWMLKLSRADFESLVEDIKTRMREITVDKCKNEEIHVPFY